MKRALSNNHPLSVVAQNVNAKLGLPGPADPHAPTVLPHAPVELAAHRLEVFFGGRAREFVVDGHSALATQLVRTNRREGDHDTRQVRGRPSDFSRSRGILKLCANALKCLVATLVAGPTTGKRLRLGGEAMHLVNMEQLPADVFAGLAPTTHLVRAQG